MPLFPLFFFFQAEDGIRDYKVTWSSDVCSSDLYASVTWLWPSRPRFIVLPVTDGKRSKYTCKGSDTIASSRAAHSAGLFAPGITDGLEDNRIKPSCVSAHVAHRLRLVSIVRTAAAWNWWLGQARASRTLTSSKTRLEESFFIQNPLYSSRRYDGGVWRDLESRKAFGGAPCGWSRSHHATAGKRGQDSAQALAGRTRQVERGFVHIFVERDSGPHDFSLMR